MKKQEETKKQKCMKYLQISEKPENETQEETKKWKWMSIHLGIVADVSVNETQKETKK